MENIFIRPPPSEDFVYYSIYFPFANSEDKNQAIIFLKETSALIISELHQFLNVYIWQKDAFNLRISSTANSDISVYQQTGYSTNAYPTQSQPNTYGQLITNDYTQISTTNYPVAASTYVPSGQQATMIYNQQRQYNPSQTTSSYQYLTQPQYGTYPQNIQYAQSTTGQSTTQSAVQVSMQTIGQSAIQSTGQLQGKKSRFINYI
ncbi:6248_t:CDS:2 [Entrophospora sp. SA101]|nr:6248_t:CDS:2 [Entrophospora sp. SA101]